MKRLISFEELQKATGLSRYQIRFYQSQGYFCEEPQVGCRVPISESLYDARWLQVWEEAQQYRKAGFSESDALEEARIDLFEGSWTGYW